MMKERILILFGADSKLEWGRSYQWARAFSKLGHEVFYVDLPESITHVSSCVSSPKDGFNMFTPKYGLPYNRVKLLKPINKRVILSQIKNALSESGFRPTIIWVYSPYEPWIVKVLKQELKPRVVVYDCADDRVAMAEQNHGKEAGEAVRKLEEELARYCDAVFVHTGALRDKKTYLSRSIFMLPNGIDTEMFSADGVHPVPVEYDGLKGRKILYTGTLAVWVDVDLIRECAGRYPGDSFVVVGPSQGDVSKIENLKNVYLLGPKPFNQMPSYIRHADLCIIPFRDTESLKSSSTLKALQYVCMGKPVLSTNYDGVNDYNGLITMARDREDFLSNVGGLTDDRPAVDRIQRENLLKDFSWSSLAASVFELLRDAKTPEKLITT